MFNQQNRVRDTVLLSGWLFADLLLGMMAIFLMAIPGFKPNVIPPPQLHIVSDIEKLTPASPQCNHSITTPSCTISLEETPDSIGPLNWSALSDMSPDIIFNPASGVLTPRVQVSITISAIPCQTGSFTFQGNPKVQGTRDIRPVTIMWSCRPIPVQLDLHRYPIIINAGDINALLADSQDARRNIKNQINGHHELDGRSVGFVVVYCGAPTDTEIVQARAVAQKVYDVIIEMRNRHENAAFQRVATYYNPLFTLGDAADRIQIDMYFFTQ